MTYDTFLEKYVAKIEKPTQNGNRLFFYTGDENIREIAQFLLNELGCRLSTATGIEVYDGFEVIHHFSDDRQGCYFCSIVKISGNNPTMNSLAPLTKAAAWIEREIHDLLGITFRDHPNLEPLLKEDNAGVQGYPLRHERKNQ